MHKQFPYLLLAIGIPILVALACSRRWKELRTWGFSLAAFAAVAANSAAVLMAPRLLPKFAALEGLKWNWTGKVAAIAVSLLIYACLPRDLRKESGILSLPKPPEWKSVAIVSAGLLLFLWVSAYLTRDGHAVRAETLWFQATMPGLDEEAFFRGVLLALLVAAFGKPWHFAGVRVGWGALPIVAFFGIAHALLGGVNEDALLTFLVTGVAGAALLWIKERTSSIWIAVLVHNLANVGAQFAKAAQ
jgi:membrane protease YdiL (CAAX protease family)